MDSMYERIGKRADTYQQLLFILGAATTTRFCTVLTIKPNSNAQHSFGVIWLCYLLSNGKPSVNLLMAAASHDLPEQVYGDTPSPIKRLLGLTETLTDLESDMLDDNRMNFELEPFEKEILKLADKMEVLLFAIVERRLGNQYMEAVYYRELMGLEKLPGAARRMPLVPAIQKLWEESCTK